MKMNKVKFVLVSLVATAAVGYLACGESGSGPYPDAAPDAKRGMQEHACFAELERISELETENDKLARQLEQKTRDFEHGQEKIKALLLLTKDLERDLAGCEHELHKLQNRFLDNKWACFKGCKAEFKGKWRR